MKALPSVLAFVLAASVASPGQAAARRAPVCLTASQVASTSVVSDQVVLFHMSNGVVWRNTLRRACPSLKLENGFSEQINGGEICANMQMIRVLRRGTPCFLGDFTQERAPSR
jgi:hypothetical protein